MKMNYKMLLLGLGVFSVSAGFAEHPTHTKHPRKSCSRGCQREKEEPREITPTAPVKAERTRFFFTLDFIEWQAQEDNLLVGMSGLALSSSSVTAPGTVTSIDFGYAPGFKAGVGVDFLYDGWDTYANYTWLQNKNMTATANTPSASQGQLIGPVASSPNSRNGVSISGDWSLYFNNIDWELGRKFFVSRKLTLRPHIGIKGAWDHQDLHVNQNLTTFTAYSLQHEHFWGVGLRGGLNTEWSFARGFSIYGNLDFAELYGQYKMDTKVFTGTARTPTQWITNAVHRMTPVMELGLGFRYEVAFAHSYRFFVSAGWEQQIWWNHNQLLSVSNTDAPQLQSSTMGGNLSFQGFDLKIGFMF